MFLPDVFKKDYKLPYEVIPEFYGPLIEFIKEKE